MAVMDSVRKAENELLKEEYAQKQVALDLYYNQNMDKHVEAHFASSSLKQIPVTTLRILPKFARARMLHYKTNPYRTIGNEQANEYLEYTYHLDTQCRIASELAWVLGGIHMRSRWNERKKRIEYDILTNVKEYFYEGESEPFGYSYEVGKDSNGNRQYYFFSEDRDGEAGMHFIFTSDNKIIPVDNNPDMINPLGINPISRIKFPYHAGDVVRACLNANIAFTEVMLAIRYQTGSPVITGVEQDIPNLKLGIDRLIVLPTGSDLSYITPNTDISGMISGIKELLTVTAQNHSLAINFSQGTTPPSGIALKIMNLENEEAREADTPIMEEFEQERYRIDRKILEVYTGRVFDESYAVDFAESKVPLEWSKEKDKYLFMLDQGLMTKKELYLKIVNPDATDEEIERKFGEIELEQEAKESDQPSNPLLKALQNG